MDALAVRRKGRGGRVVGVPSVSQDTANRRSGEAMSDMVRAAVQVGPRQIEIREFPRPEVGPDTGLLRVEANGICGSDVETFKGHMGMGSGGPFVPGHEPLGIVEEIGGAAAARR